MTSSRRAPPAPPGMLVFLALRTLREHRLSLALLLLAIAAGVGFQVPTRGNLAGYRAEILEQQVTAGWGQVRVRPRKGERFRDAAEIIAAIRGVSDVAHVQPVLLLHGSVGRGGGVSVVTVTGVGAGQGRPYRLAGGRDLAAGD